MKTHILGLSRVFVATILLAGSVGVAQAATLTVINTSDSGPGSLRQTLADANNSDDYATDFL